MEKLYSVNAEGCSIRCRLFADSAQIVRTVIVCGHGFAGHKDSRSLTHFAERILAKNRGAAVVCFDWPCHGDDVHRTLRLDDCGKYLRLVLADVREKYGDCPVFGYAVSFGGYLFLKYLSENGSPFVRTALRCPAVNMYEVILRANVTEADLDRLRKGKTVPVGFDRKVGIDMAFLESLKRADLTRRDFLPWADELLILHGTKDEIVPFDVVRDFAEQNVIDFVPVENADHRFQDPAKMDLANARIAAFFGLH